MREDRNFKASDVSGPSIWILIILWFALRPSQIQHGGFIRARMRKSEDMIRDQVRILYLLFLWKK
jgi:hypothetical protein